MCTINGAYPFFLLFCCAGMAAAVFVRSIGLSETKKTEQPTLTAALCSLYDCVCLKMGMFILLCALTKLRCNHLIIKDNYF